MATEIGSTAYNHSAHGPILPVGAGLRAPTPISAMRPRRWPGALIPQTSVIHFEVMEPAKRPSARVLTSGDPCRWARWRSRRRPIAAYGCTSTPIAAARAGDPRAVPPLSVIRVHLDVVLVT